MKEDTIEMNFHILQEFIQDIIDTILPCKYRSWYVGQNLFKEHKYPDVYKVDIMNCKLNLFPEGNEDTECQFYHCYNCKKREKGDL